MTDNIERLTLSIAGSSDADPRELAQLTTQLRRRLLEFDVESVQTVSVPEVPSGSKAGELVVLGALLVDVGPHVLPAIVEFLAGWVTRRPVREVDLRIGGDTLKLTNASREDQETALRLFVNRHARR